MLYVGIASIALAIGLIVYLVGDRSAAAKVGTAGGSIASHMEIVLPATATPDNDVVPSVLVHLGSFARRLTPSNYGKGLQHRLDIAGNPRGWAAERVLGLKGAGLVIGVALGLLLGAGRGVGILLWPIGLGAAGFFLPDIWVRNLGERRQQELQLGLPDAIDMMTVCVEAGLGFDSALARVALNLEGPVASEFARVLQEMQFGKSRTEALRALVDRTDVSELRTFVSALIQSAELGISVGEVLREQSREMRVKRRQRAEEKAQKLPVKILLPLLTCMLPAIFVVVLGPAVMSIIKTLGSLTH